MSAQERVELEGLLSALCDQQLDEAGFARLEGLLAADPECRRMYLEYLDIHASLVMQPRLVNSPRAAAATSAVPASPSPSSSQKARRIRLHWGAENYRHALLVLGALAASLLVQVLWMPPLFSERTPPGDLQPKNKLAQAPAKNGTYVATLVHAVNCQWDAPRNPGGDGARLAPGKIRLPKGIASIRFDAGPELIVQGPAEINVDSATGVTVLSGKVVIRTTDSDAPFDVRTPSSTLVDTGAEAAVSVSPEAEEVHVFEGELQRVSKKPGTVEPENLKAGDARRYDIPTGTSGKAAIDADQFVRHIEAVEKADPAAGLIAYEGFTYADKLALQTGKENGGVGWAGPWRASIVRPSVKAERDRYSLNVKESLVRAGAAVPSVGGSFDYTGFAKSFRKLARPIALDADGIYYLSFLFRRQAPIDGANSVALVLWSDDDYQQKNFLDFRKRLFLGVKGFNQVETHLERMNANASLPLSAGTTYLMVAKIAAGRSRPDQIFLSVYGPEDQVEDAETGRWSVKSAPFRSDLSFEWVELQLNGKGRQTIDEIRVGTTWASVMSPWASSK